MPIFHLNIFNDADVRDVEGSEFADLAAAKNEAIRGARELMADHVAHGRAIDLRHRIEIAADDGAVLAVIPFGEVITVVGE